MLEIGKLSAHVERLIADVKSHGEKLDKVAHQSTYIKGAIAASTVFVTVIVGLFSWALSVKWDAILAALQALGKVH